jgi:hypothetical protein
MNRRNFLRTTAATALAAPTLSALDRNAIIEMRYVRMRNSSDNQVHRNTEFTGKHLLPALQRAGIGPMGFFMSMIGPDSPFLRLFFSYPSLSAMEVAYDKLRADREYQKELAAFNSLPARTSCAWKASCCTLSIPSRTSRFQSRTASVHRASSSYGPTNPTTARRCAEK